MFIGIPTAITLHWAVGTAVGRPKLALGEARRVEDCGPRGMETVSEV